MATPSKEEGPLDDEGKATDAARANLRSWHSSVLGDLHRRAFAVAVSSGLGVGSFGGAAGASGWLRWALLGLSGASLVLSGIIASRSRLLRAARKRERETSELRTENQHLLEGRTELEREIDGLTEQVIALEQFRSIAKEEAEEEALRAAADARKRALYADVFDDVAAGLAYAMSPEGPPSSIMAFIEDNSLKPIAETLREGLLPDAPSTARIEVGIAQRSGPNYVVTHASGPQTGAMKAHGPCYSADKPFNQVLSRKAAAHFVRDGHHQVPLIGMENEQYLFVLSTVHLGAGEREWLARHAGLIKLTVAALTRIGIR
jgi:hypothetical protein